MSFEQIDAAHALALTADAAWREAGGMLLDVREQHEWDRGHSPVAVHIPMSSLGERLDELPSAQILVVCRSGARSARVVDALTQLGYEASNVEGGMIDWKNAGGALVAANGAEPAVD